MGWKYGPLSAERTVGVEVAIQLGRNGEVSNKLWWLDDRRPTACQAGSVSELERAFRERLFDQLDDRLRFTNGTLASRELASFTVDGEQRRLIAAQKGIWNPSWQETTLSVVSAADGPYADEELAPGVWRYDYQARSDQGDNTKLRRAYELGLPIILLRRVDKGVYVPLYPVYVTGDNRAEKYFVLTVAEARLSGASEDPDTRRYVERLVNERVHQREFRSRVLIAYRDRCAVCRLQHPELLDAAHILPDRHKRGLPVVPNGLSLCKIHHSAYDLNFLGIDADYRVHINQVLLEERDGPMLKHGLQEMHGSVLSVPKRTTLRPDKDNLAERFEGFQAAS